MKKTLVLTLGGVVLALGACAAPETPAGSLESSETHSVAPVAAEPFVSESDRIDQAIASVMEPEGFILPEGFYYEYAEIVCEGLDDGLGPMLLAGIGHSEFDEYSLDQHAMMVGASIGGLCPEYADVVLNY